MSTTEKARDVSVALNEIARLLDTLDQRKVCRIGDLDESYMALDTARRALADLYSLIHGKDPA